MAALPVSYADVEAAARRLAGVAHRTPVLRARAADERVGASVLFKAEPFQRVGAFKFRGAYNALSVLEPAARERGALTWSSGNHAQALALAGRLLATPVTVVMPEDAPAPKLAATRAYGAEVVLYDRRKAVREELGRALAAERGLAVVPPYDHEPVIAGQGTATKELIEDEGPLDLLLVPVGGGGLISGSAIAARALAPRCRVIGVEPERADDATRSFRSGLLQRVHEPETIADGARTPCLGERTFPIVRALVADMVTVSEADILLALRFLWERLKVVVEPTGALGFAALLSGALRPPAGARVGVVLSGGNVELERLLPALCG